MAEKRCFASNGRSPLLSALETAINAIWSVPMSTAFSVASLSPRQAPLLPATGLQENNSWRPAAAPWRLLQRWAERRAQRHALVELADQTHLLADIGLTRAQVLREAARPFWQV